MNDDIESTRLSYMEFGPHSVSSKSMLPVTVLKTMQLPTGIVDLPQGHGEPSGHKLWGMNLIHWPDVHCVKVATNTNAIGCLV